VLHLHVHVHGIFTNTIHHYWPISTCMINAKTDCLPALKEFFHLMLHLIQNPLNSISFGKPEIRRQPTTLTASVCTVGYWTQRGYTTLCLILTLVPPIEYIWSFFSTSTPEHSSHVKSNFIYCRQYKRNMQNIRRPTQWRFYIGARGAKPPKS